MIISLCRTIILYIVVMCAIRLMGKRQIGELQPSELVITILVSELATLPMQDFDIPIMMGIIPIVTLVFFEHIVSFICLKNVKIRRLVNGNPCIIIQDGVLDIKTMRDLRVSVDEVLEELRINNVTNIEDIKFAIIETNGQLSYILKNGAETVTNDMLSLVAPEKGLPLIIINDGCVIDENLISIKRDMLWLVAKLNEKKLSINQVFLMTSDSYDNIFIQERDVQIE